jgi:hypothetical protein
MMRAGVLLIAVTASTCAYPTYVMRVLSFAAHKLQFGSACCATSAKLGHSDQRLSSNSGVMTGGSEE